MHHIIVSCHNAIVLQLFCGKYTTFNNTTHFTFSPHPWTGSFITMRNIILKHVDKDNNIRTSDDDDELIFSPIRSFDSDDDLPNLICGPFPSANDTENDISVHFDIPNYPNPQEPEATMLVHGDYVTHPGGRPEMV